MQLAISSETSKPGSMLVRLVISWVVCATPAMGQFGAVGISAVRAQRIPDFGVPLVYIPEAEDRFGHAVAIGDFDGDGADDLAVGVPNGDAALAGAVEGSGIVVIRYSIRGEGLVVLGDPSLILTQAGGPDAAESSDGFGSALAACDFNGDGFDDLAVGVPYEGEPGAAYAGAVDVYYGSQSGLSTSAAQHLTQSTPGFGEVSENPDLFGSALACGELIGGAPFADLAIGAWDETLDDATDPKFGAGMVLVARGTAGGLSAVGSLMLHQDVPGMADLAESSDYFGWALAVLDMNGDGFDDLAIGVPGEDNPLSDRNGRGAVHLVFGTAAGLAMANNFLRTESAFGGNSELDDQFGSALSAGDFDGDGFDDLAIGGPYEDVGTAIDAGQVVAVYGRAAAPFFDFGRTQFWTEDAIHGTGTSEASDRFGFSLAAADFDGDGRADLAIGHPGEFLIVPDDGVVTVIMGAPGGLTAARRDGFAAGYRGVPGPANQADRNFGASLASGDFDGDGHADLVIGIPAEDADGFVDVGAAVVLYGSLFSDGFESGGVTAWVSTQ